MSRATRCWTRFAGSGALGLEALSRGAARLPVRRRRRAAPGAVPGTMHSPSASPIAAVSSRRRGRLLRDEAAAGRRYDLVLLDPPYHALPACYRPARAARRRSRPTGRVVARGAARRQPALFDAPADVAATAPPSSTFTRHERRRHHAHSAPGRTALCPGTYDPVTFGHIDVIARAARLFDRVVVGVVRYPSTRRPVRSRRTARADRRIVRDLPNVVVAGFSQPGRRISPASGAPAPS